MSSTKITIGNYLLTKLHQFGVKDIFGVPGDFNMEFLDLIEDSDKVRWVGNCNELEAAYAADGYSRTSGIGCLVTTFGVGELSAINGVAGSFSEKVPVVHVVGSPALKFQKAGANLHHTLGDGDFKSFHEMSTKVATDHCLLDSPSRAFDDIDRILYNCWAKVKPVYISLPTDVCNIELEIEKSRLDPPKLEPVDNDLEAESEAISRIVEALKSAKNPVVIVDACILRHKVVDEVKSLLDQIKLPVLSSPMGKGIIDEIEYPYYCGVFQGEIGDTSAKNLVEKSDLILSIGAIKSDFNTGGFSYTLNTKTTVELHSDFTKIFNAVYQKVGFKQLMPKLEKELKDVKLSSTSLEVNLIDTNKGSNSDELDQDYLWKVAQKLTTPGSIVVAETGTSVFGILKTRFPKNTLCITQLLWGSIGYTVGAALGAGIAAQSSNKFEHVTLWVGDGSFQLTVQSVSTMVRYGISATIFLLNNRGYAIEKHIHGKERKYNDVQNWDYSKTLDYFGCPEDRKGIVEVIKSISDLDRVANKLLDKGGRAPGKVNFIEVHLKPLDAPQNLIKQAAITAKANYEI